MIKYLAVHSTWYALRYMMGDVSGVFLTNISLRAGPVTHFRPLPIIMLNEIREFLNAIFNKIHSLAGSIERSPT